ncbi:hypothetical protein BRD03_07930 [Halobacteriales archaeon QS_9_68_17]|nr:MAG: hypothetical protein BRD03_07930 [Halobacteriales archaeon QS_9_68_17]
MIRPDAVPRSGAGRTDLDRRRERRFRASSSPVRRPETGRSRVTPRARSATESEDGDTDEVEPGAFCHRSPTPDSRSLGPRRNDLR